MAERMMEEVKVRSQELKKIVAAENEGIIDMQVGTLYSVIECLLDIVENMANKEEQR